jgi:immune inhibitor A
MSCWCLTKLGWITAANVKAAQTLSISPLAVDKTACYRLWTDGKASPEYFLLENRQQTGMDESLPGEGLAVWHIDETQSGNTNPASYLVALVQADGRNDLELNRNAGDSGDLFPGSAKVTSAGSPTTNANNGSPTGVGLSQIKLVNGVVKVKVKV